MIDYDNLIERLRGYCQEWEAYNREQYRHDLEDAAEGISKIYRLQAENEKLRAELEQAKAERDAAGECINTVYSYILIKSKTDAVRTIEKWWRGPKED